MTEQTVLTMEEVERAERREGIDHPVLQVFEDNLATIAMLDEIYRNISDNSARQKFVRENFGFLAVAFVKLPAFTLEPLELLAIWSRAVELFHVYMRYELAAVLSAAYAIQGLANPGWKKFPRTYLETGNLPAEVLEDRDGLLQVKAKLQELKKGREVIDIYVFGIENPMEKSVELAKRARDGDKEADKEFDLLIERQKSRQTKAISELGENFGQGLIWHALRDALSRIDQKTV